MQINESQGQGCSSISLQGDRRWHDIWSVWLSILLSVLLRSLRQPEWVFVAADCVGSCWPLYVVIRRQFGRTLVTVNDDGIKIFRSTRLSGRTVSFPKSEVEKIGYLGGDQYDDPSIGMMVHSRIMPVCFGRGLSPQEAAEIFDSLHSSGCWLADHIVPVGKPLF